MLLSYLRFCLPPHPPPPPPTLQKRCHGYQKVFNLSLAEMNTILKETEKAGKALTKVLKVMDSLSKVASCFGFVGSILGLILAFIPQSDPNMEFMKEQFSEINRKLDSIALQIDSLAKEIEWDTYASTYGRDENAIKNSWAELMKFLEQAPALDERRKASLAEAFTSHYTNSATRNSVSNFYRYLTENEDASLNKNLLQLVIQKSKGDVKILSMYSGYFLSLMVKGLQLNVYYDIMMGYGGVSGAKEGVERLTTMLTAMKDAMIQCVDETLNWALEDANKIKTEQFSSNLELANAIGTKLNQKFIWYEWTVIVHDINNEEEKGYGHTTDLIAQDKAKIHIIYREKNFIVNEGIKMEIQRQLGESQCFNMKKHGLSSPFADRTLKHLEYIHTVYKDSNYAQTPTRGLIEFQCSRTIQTEYGSTEVKMFDLTIFLKSNDVVEQDPCSKNKCHNDGKCKQLKDTTEELCICTRMFTGQTCEESIKHFIDFSAIEAQLNSIALKPVPDMTAIYYSINDLQSFIKIQVQTIRNDILCIVND
uniref:EGF-like domain-containing protein n=1 Tax=Esox lucius TaxID=8010 RepID=A0A3P8YUB6_ESOLU